MLNSFFKKSFADLCLNFFRGGRFFIFCHNLLAFLLQASLTTILHKCFFYLEHLCNKLDQEHETSPRFFIIDTGIINPIVSSMWWKELFTFRLFDSKSSMLELICINVTCLSSCIPNCKVNPCIIYLQLFHHKCRLKYFSSQGFWRLFGV